MRTGEMYTRERSQSDLERRTIFRSKTKNGSKRQVLMLAVLVAKLTAYGSGSELGLGRRATERKQKVIKCHSFG